MRYCNWNIQMTEKNTPSNDTSSSKETKLESQTPAKEKTAEAKVEKSTAAKSKPASKVTSKSDKATMTQPPKRSKTAIAALILSLTALAGLGGGYVWQNQQHKAFVDELQQQNQQQLQATETQLAQLINQQQATTLANAEQSTQHFAQQIKAESIQPIEEELASLKLATQELQQNDPTDWLAHEAEYLIRIASRAMWLEKDAEVAINLLQDADLRVKELNNPELLPVRQLINQDIEALSMLPKLATEDVILKLMALSNNIADLPIAMAHLPDTTEQAQSFELSENTADWRENLSKTWQKFMADFITVKRRTANVEALLTPSQQQNLRQNLQLKLQLAQWAATQHNAKLFDQALIESQHWITEYFDTDDVRVSNFSQSLIMLQSEIIELTLPKKLDALSAIRSFIKNDKQKASQPVNEFIEAVKEEAKEEVKTESDDNGAIL